MAGLRVFISYAFVDEQHPDYLFAQRLAADLRQAGVDVVVDAANVGEQAFVQRLNNVLPSCQWLIVVQTPAAIQSLRVQMSVNTALQLVTQLRMQKVLAVVAAPCETHDMPLTWESLTVFDATQDYARALARVLLEVEGADLASTFAMRSSSIRLSEPGIDRPVSREDDQPSGLPPLFTHLKSEGDRPSSPPPPVEISKGGRSERDLPQPLSTSYSVSPSLSRRWLLAFSATMALLLLIVGGSLFYSLSLRKGSDIAIAVTHSKATATTTTTKGIPLASTPSAVVPSPTATPREPSPTATSRRPSPTAVPNRPGITPTHVQTPQPQPVDAYSNYGSANAGHAMCRGNPGDSLSMPGGTASQTFTVPAGVASLSSALVQIDPDSSVTAHLSVAVNGNVAATANAAAAGDTRFGFGPIGVRAGDAITLTISFTATYGKIITVYTAGNPGGTFTASNSCPDGAPNVSTASTGLRGVVSGMS